MKFLFLLSITLFALGCKTTEEVIVDQPIVDSRLNIIASLGEINVPSDPTTITNVRIEGNTMFIDMSYTGGCEEHTFKVVGSEAISKSLPPVRSFQIIHSSKGDQCKKIIEETLTVDISKLTYKPVSGSIIYLFTEGWNNKIEYSFK
ncbi:MAG: hypothetical protein RI883_163 [Bacteroidota bacterium]|jgi:hypothetical protein